MIVFTLIVARLSTLISLLLSLITCRSSLVAHHSSSLSLLLLSSTSKCTQHHRETYTMLSLSLFIALISCLSLSLLSHFSLFSFSSRLLSRLSSLVSRLVSRLSLSLSLFSHSSQFLVDNCLNM